MNDERSAPSVTLAARARTSVLAAPRSWFYAQSSSFVAQNSLLDMVVALLSLELHFAMAQSLKDKRMVLRGIKDRIQKHNVAMAEVEHQELWQRAGLAIVTVATSEDRAEQELESVIAEIERVEPGTVSRSEIEFLA
jgi:uncharacterized protein YlxP (DUF503 family)